MDGRAWLLIVASVWMLGGCSEEDGVEAGSDAGEDAATWDGHAADAADAPLETFGVPLCDELGVDNVLPYDTTITNDFAMNVVDDCRVIQLLLPLTQDEANLWFERTSAWTGAFFGCPGTDGSVTSFGPVETGKNPVLSTSDIDLLVEHFAAATESSLTLSSEQSTLLRSELAAVAAAAVNVPIAGHSSSLCSDGGVDAGGADAGFDGAAGAAGSDAGADAAQDASDAGVDP